MTETTGRIEAHGVDEEPLATYERDLATGMTHWVFLIAAILYSAWHLYTLNIAPIETITYRILHVAGALCLGFALAMPVQGKPAAMWPEAPRALAILIDAAAALLVLAALGMLAYANWIYRTTGQGIPEPWVFANFGQTLMAGTALAIIAGWLFPARPGTIPVRDWVLIGASIAVCGFLIYGLEHMGLRMRAGTGRADPQNGWAAAVGVMLILELTRRVAGLALVIIAAVFVAYAFLGPYLPGILEHRGYSWVRFFSYVYTGNGILGPTTAVSSTYIILFIIFAAFLQASKVGDYFVNFAFAAAGGARGGPAKVAIFGSGLMGMINGTSAGNVVSTGSLTIPLMKKVGYKPQTSASIEAAASSGGQILPPIMGAGAFIMAEITGIQYREIVIAAIIPAVLYFISVYFMVDKEALKKGMAGLPRSQLPKFREMAKQAYLFIPIVMLIGALYVGYSVIRAGTYAMIGAFAVSYIRVVIDGREDGWWNHLTGLFLCALALMPLVVAAQILIHGWGEERMLQLGVSVVASAVAVAGLWVMSRGEGRLAVGVSKAIEHFRMIPYAFEIAAKMSLQLVAVCAAAGVIVGVIAITGVGTRLSGVLMAIAGQSPILALFFAMVVAIILGMGMPTTAAYAVAASVMAPGLIRMGIEPLTAHFFIFYYAVMSAITPPVALAAYAGAAIAQSDPMRTSVESFKIGLAAFVVPFMFFYSQALLMQGEWYEVLHVFLTACLGIYLLASAVQGWFFGVIPGALRAFLLAAGVAMIAGGWMSDVIGLGAAAIGFLLQRHVLAPATGGRAG